MTYQDNIETLRGALCDYHDVCDSQPDCFACDDTHACEELFGFGGPEEDGMCYNSYRSDVPGDGTILHRARVDDRSTCVMSAPKPTVTEDGDRLLSSDSEPPGDTETSGPDFGGPFPCVMDVPIPNDTEVSDRSPSDIQFLHVCSCVRQNEESSLLAGLETLVESVYHQMFHNFDSEFGDVLGRADAGAPGDEIVRESDFEQDIGHGDEVMRWGLPCYSVIRMWRLVWQGLCGVDTTGDMVCCQLGTASCWCWDRMLVGAGRLPGSH